MVKVKPRKRKQMDLEDYLRKIRDRGLNDKGELVPDPTPVAPPVGYKRQPTMVELIRNMVRSEKLAEETRAAGFETFEESEDFDIGDDGEDLKSGFENDFDPPIAEISAEVEASRPSPADPAGSPSEAVVEAPAVVSGAEEPAEPVRKPKSS